jgi:c-di-GMP-binding flagellar brake protein YcgR
MQNNGANRRQFVRIDINDIVQCLPMQESDAHAALKARAKNISAGGILIESSKKYSLGDSFRVEVSLPGWHVLRYGFLSIFKRSRYKDNDLFSVVGNVVRVDEVSENIYFIGVQFADLPERDRQALNKYIEKLHT